MSKTISQRTCVGCQTKKPKNKLVRIAVGENNNLTINKTGKVGGRGAYLCKSKIKSPWPPAAAGRQKSKVNENCLEMAIEKKAFQRAFRRKVNPDNLWQNKQEKLQKNQNFNLAPQ